MNRMIALVVRDYKIFMTSHWRLLELLYFPVTTVLIWGVFALWTRELASAAGTIALAVNIFWSWAYTVQTSINIAINEDVWSGSGPEIFATGINKWEYIGARIMLSAILSAMNILIIAAISQLFGFFDFVGALVPSLALLGAVFIASIGLAMFVAGIFFTVGTEHTWLAWSAMQIFIVLSSPLTPPSVLPEAFQAAAEVMPFTALFEGVRAVSTGQAWSAFAQSAFAMAIVYLFIGLAVYHVGFEHARCTGKLARMF
ncbi:MAG: hypothetical protein QW548_01275 [Candidatus Aenigmatarchaeota archaeon]